MRKTGALRVYSNGDWVELSGETITICKTGLANMLASGMNGERSISIAGLTAVQLKLGGLWSPGYMLFAYAGSKPFMGGVWDATQDPDSFMFSQDLNERMSDFKKRVDEAMREFRQPGQGAGHPPLGNQLRELYDLKIQGILSQDEYETAKRKLLS
jgi:hypothetical protein